MQRTGPVLPGGVHSLGVLDPLDEISEQGLTEGPWQTVVWNDPVNLMSYVVHVFRTYFGYELPVATGLMHRVHEDGRAVVSRGSREQAESDVQAMHSYGLRATLEEAGQD
jgi:ATP-dependent Clp protease adaptor protein ClpS